MLSKTVKARRSWNRALRREPAWRVAMCSYKMQQLTIVRLHVMHLQSLVAPPGEEAIHLAKIQAKLEDVENLKYQRDHMLREDWYTELDLLNGHHCDMRSWMILLYTNED